MKRRDFLKILGISTTAAVGSSCVEGWHWMGSKSEKLIPYLVPPEDDVPVGQSRYFHSTCTECSSNCGMTVKLTVKTTGDEPIKVEGNPLHPVNGNIPTGITLPDGTEQKIGGLCIRGQTTLSRLYNPDRLTQPHLKSGGMFTPVSWDKALTTIKDKIDLINKENKDAKKKKRHAFLAGNTTGTLDKLIEDFCERMGVVRLPEFELDDYAALRTAHQMVFGRREVPQYHVKKTDVLVTVGADLLESFVNPVQYSSEFAQARKGNADWHWTHFEPHLSTTGMQANQSLKVKAGSEIYLLRHLFHALAKTKGWKLDKKLTASVPKVKEEEVSKTTGLDAKQLNDKVKGLVERIAKAKNPLVISGGPALATESGLEVAVITALIQEGLGAVNDTVDFTHAENMDRVGTRADLKKFSEGLAKDQVGMLFITRANPLPFAPASYKLKENLAKAGFRVGMGYTLDETLRECDLVLPLPHCFETIGDTSPRRGVTSLIGPVVHGRSFKDLNKNLGPVYKASPFAKMDSEGDVLLKILHKVKKTEEVKGVAKKFDEFLYDHWVANAKQWAKEEGGLRNKEYYLEKFLGQGFYQPKVNAVKVDVNKKIEDFFGDKKANLSPKLKDGLKLMVLNSSRSHDGVGDGIPLHSEIPDVLSTVSWGEFVSVSKTTAKELGVYHGDEVSFKVGGEEFRYPVFVQPVLPDGVVMFKHRKRISPALATDDRCGQVVNVATITLTKTGGYTKLPILSGALRNHDQYPNPNEGRGMTEKVDPYHHGSGHLRRTLKGHGHGDDKDHGHETAAPANQKKMSSAERLIKGDQKGPGPNGLYPTPHYEKYRWAMAIDMDVCNGCSACVAACYIENNVPVAGRDEHLIGRELSWLYFQPEVSHDEETKEEKYELLPMLCQQCSNAPCEPVCPVFAAVHNSEGLNNQVYNRCVGTRYCANNCTYKVRRFNWYDYTGWENRPMGDVFNPDVFVRGRGVMEKCTFCIQRIRVAKDEAKDRVAHIVDRAEREKQATVRDGEVTPACAQSCPAGAITFGNILDEKSQVHQLAKSDRQFRVLEELGTLPAVYYLGKKG